MFLGIPENAGVEYQPDIYPGDLLLLKQGMMLIEPNGPVQVLKADNDNGIYEIRYLTNDYIISCGRIDIKGHLN